MIIEFVWIDNYGVINNQGFNFNPNIFYSFDKQTSELIREERKSIPSDFFSIENDTVLSVSAIVGANGTGKSTVLEFLCRFLTTHRPLGGFIVTDKFIVNKSDFSVYFSKIWSGEKQTFLNREELISVYEDSVEVTRQRSIDDSRNHKLGLRILENLVHDTRLIYYAGEPNLRHTNRVSELLLSLSDEYENSHYTDLSDISLMAKDQEVYRSKNAIYSGENVLLTHRSGESSRFLKLILGEHRKVIPFSLNNIDISIGFNDINTAFFQSYDELGFKTILALVSDYLQSKGRKTKMPTPTITFVNNLRDYGFHQYFERRYDRWNRKTEKSLRRSLYHQLLLRQIREQILRTMGELSEDNKLESFLSILIEIETSFNSQEDYLTQIRDYFTNSKFATSYTGQIKSAKVEAFLEKLVSLGLWENERLILKLTDSKLQELNSALQTFDSESGMRYQASSIFDFDIRGLSTGEKQFLKLFSRFISFGLNNIDNPLNEKSFIILIDEFENGFHPLWQRKFLSVLIKFLERYVNQSNENKIRVQLIFTSHSPFIVSDLPKQCINFLSREPNEEYSEVDKLEKHTETLGANIHDLYADSFFLQGALMGDFAKQKIENVISVLNDKEMPIENSDSIRLSIERIGEPIIKVKLAEKLAERLGENPEVARLRAQQHYISQRLKEIENNDSNKDHPAAKS